jgi:poly-gamma-glutamate synthesis protein (capsule biosynthesis protein)
MQRCRTEAGVQAIIAMPHWGHEGTREIAGGQREWARWLIEHGADAVAGSGPHCPQELDAWLGRPICYSTGNLHAHAFGPPNNARRGILRLDCDAAGRIIGAVWMEDVR